jgi:KamA family protein
MDGVNKRGHIIRSLEDLRDCLSISEKEYCDLKDIHKIHPFKSTPYYLSLINPFDKNDPIRRMVVPAVEELADRGLSDTSGELENTRIRGVQHKYPQTVLFLLTNSCYAYCRFCFRKRFVGVDESEIMREVKRGVEYVKSQRQVTSVLLTGGDALSLETGALGAIIEKLSAVPHLRILRIGSRVPVVFPQRISQDRDLLSLLGSFNGKGRRVIIQTHFNHPRELTNEAENSISVLLSMGVLVYNQTVLLKGVNDHPATLARLLRNLVGAGVLPYYFFQFRPVSRAVHFQVPLVRGYYIIEEVKRRVSGPAKMFRYVMSHWSGKIEVIGLDKEKIYMKYHQAKLPENRGKFFALDRSDSACWIDELVPLEKSSEEGARIFSGHMPLPSFREIRLP